MAVEIVTQATANTDPPTCYGDGQIYKHAALPTVLTANLPSASAAMNGRLIIENGGTGDGNLIVYVNAQRFRINGGSNV